MSFEYTKTDPDYLHKQFSDVAHDMMAEFLRMKRDRGTHTTDEGECLEKLIPGKFS